MSLTFIHTWVWHFFHSSRNFFHCHFRFGTNLDNSWNHVYFINLRRSRCNMTILTNNIRCCSCNFTRLTWVDYCRFPDVVVIITFITSCNRNILTSNFWFRSDFDTTWSHIHFVNLRFTRNHFTIWTLFKWCRSCHFTRFPWFYNSGHTNIHRIIWFIYRFNRNLSHIHMRFVANFDNLRNHINFIHNRFTINNSSIWIQDIRCRSCNAAISPKIDNFRFTVTFIRVKFIFDSCWNRLYINFRLCADFDDTRSHILFLDNWWFIRHTTIIIQFVLNGRGCNTF